MKKIILALSPEGWSSNAVDMACYLAKLSGSKVNIVFLQQHKDTHDAPQLMESASFHETAVFDERIYVKRMQDACISRDAAYSINRDYLVTVDELVEETMFADVLVIDPSLSLKQDIGISPSSLAKHILHHACCPAILAQGSFAGMEEIIFTCNGSKASVYAIKQFTYLFPGLTNSRITILEINTDSTEEEKEKIKLLEWIHAHYHHITYITLEEGNTAAALSRYLLSRPEAITVMGAYGRSFISRLLKPSTANPVAGMVTNALFITHQ